MVKQFIYTKEPTIEEIAIELGINPSSISRIQSGGEITIEFENDIVASDIQKLDGLFPGLRRKGIMP